MSIDLSHLLEQSGAILHGHFLLTSGRHSDVYFEKFRLLEQPLILTALCGEVSSHFKDSGVELVAGPATGGIIVAFETARQMSLNALYIETENGVKTLRRGAKLEPGTRILLVDDVLTTGKSLGEVADALRERGAVVVGAAVLIDRSETSSDLGCPVFAVHRVKAQSYPADDIPASLKDIPVTKPGTRTGRG